MSFVPFASLDTATQERIVLAPGPKIDIEPVIFHCEGTTKTTGVIHLQVGDSHVILRPVEVEVEDFFFQFRRALLSLQSPGDME